MDHIQKLYNEEHDELEMKLRSGEISDSEFENQLRKLKDYCNEQEGLRAEYELWGTWKD